MTFGRLVLTWALKDRKGANETERRPVLPSQRSKEFKDLGLPLKPSEMRIVVNSAHAVVLADFGESITTWFQIWEPACRLPDDPHILDDGRVFG